MSSISVIIVTCNSSGYIKDCLDSVFAQAFPKCEIIAVDNNSKDGTIKILKDQYPEVRLIENPVNYGPCKARNQGIALVTGKYILCLDHDVRLRENSLADLYQAIEADDGVGAAGPKILTGDGRSIYSAGIYNSFLLRFHDIGGGQPVSSANRKKEFVFGLSAAAALYRREALESVKQNGEYFDEDFFYFFEDVDLSWRLNRRGWRSLYIPQAECLHAAGRSRKKDRISQYLCLRNRYFTILKNESLSGLFKLAAAFLLYDFWRNLFMLAANPYYFLKAAGEVAVAGRRILGKRKTYATGNN